MRQMNNKQDLANRITESVLNEIGDTNRGQYMLGRLAGRKYANNYNTNGYDESGKIAKYAQQQKQYKSGYNPYTSGYDNGFEGNDGKEGYDYYKEMDENKKRIRKIVSEALRKRLNEIGDTNRGQYMLGRLAAKKEKQNYYNTYAPELERDRQVRRISNYADEKSNGDFNKETAFRHGYHDYSKDNTFHTVGDNFERYRKQDENPILQKVGELRQMTENLLNRAYSQGNGARVSLSDIKYMYGLSKEIHDYFDNNVSSQLLNILETMLNSKSFEISDVLQIDDLLKDLEQ